MGFKCSQFLRTSQIQYTVSSLSSRQNAGRTVSRWVTYARERIITETKSSTRIRRSARFNIGFSRKLKCTTGGTSAVNQVLHAGRSVAFPRKILIVDDDLGITEMLAMKLRCAEFEVFQAHSGQDALDQLKTCNPDLLLLDIAMPEIAAWTFWQTFVTGNSA